MLRRKAKPVAKISTKERGLLGDMVETMADYVGTGLAAPQVGVSQRMIVVRCEEDETLLLANPEIVFRSDDTEISVEGCLSIPGFQGDVERHFSIRVRGQDESGETLEYDLRGFPARVVQHEVDHLDGKLYIDRIIPDTLNAVSYEDDPETGEEKVVLTPVTLDELRTHFAQMMHQPPSVNL